mgnify:CR=1 FL=1
MENNNGLNNSTSKKLLLNLARLSKQGYEKIRLIRAKDGNYYFLACDNNFEAIYAFDVQGLKSVGKVLFNIDKNNKKLAHVDVLNVEPKRKGIGTALMQYCEHLLKQQGVKQIKLYASRSRASLQHSKLVKFYNKLGYKSMAYAFGPEPMLKTKTVYHKPKIKTPKQIVDDLFVLRLKQKSKLTKIITGQSRIEKALNKKLY